MRPVLPLYLFSAAAFSLTETYAWGAAGHQIVATIAQMYLHPNVLPSLCDILDLPSNKCHLSFVASWADQQRRHMRWSGPLHYVGAIDDYPSQTCAFPGEHKWAGEAEINVLDGIKNTTSLLQAWVRNDVNDDVAKEALKFLIHFVGDMHQPLHLTGRARGGNSIAVLFDRRHTNLHSVWDNFILSKLIREVPENYSNPLPYPEVEAVLFGAIYDPYIRRILHEGVFSSWNDDIPDWLSCPTPSNSAFDQTSAKSLSTFLGSAFNAVHGGIQTIMTMLNPKTGVDIIPDGPIICPYFWAQPIHSLNCDIVWPAEIDDPQFQTRLDFVSPECVALEAGSDDLDPHLQPPCHTHEANGPLIQLDTTKYFGVIAKRMLLERLLAQGGIRLAGILNYIFAPIDSRDSKGLFVI